MAQLVVLDREVQRLHDLTRSVAASELHVLIEGESGTGKKTLAHSLHRRSQRAARPLFPFDCSVVTADGNGWAERTFASAGGGTVLLDRVDKLPLAAQTSLKRYIEDGEPRGAAMPRFVSTSERDLDAEVQPGRFRADLYYLLAGVTLKVPPLRLRRLEIPVLAQIYAARARARVGLPAPEITDQALDLMESHSWPGNIPELRNVMERAVLLAGDAPIDVAHLPVEQLRAHAPRVAGDLRRDLADEEKLRIVAALAQCGGNQTRAAKLLGMPRRTLVSRLDEYGIARPRRPRQRPA
ncbi:MAG: sigma-54-dependent Fis family transcriptional regulator [Deltaproteobacteria bacterium]|nr:sigma-54-dependent Fis family transcriptional regulator [Deltaproteobacteria bacterium]